MKVTLLASSQIKMMNFDMIGGSEFDRYHALIMGPSSDRLAHFAGRACYQAWDMPNPATANDMGYLANILRQGHESVLEHASATFYIEGVSRSLLAEITRHRHLSFSVESQRYVDYSNTEPVYPPASQPNENYIINSAYDDALDAYDRLYENFREQGLTRKQAREAARSVLPNCAPVAMVVTGNMRAWRDVLKKRYSTHADAEIFELAKELLRQLKCIAPASFQDIEEPF
jgi:thymidylate synthase (FAD)